MTRARTAASLLAAFVLHLLVIAVLAVQLPAPAHASAAPTAPVLHQAHEASTGSGSSQGSSLFDLTPPEVRRLGGPTLVEVLEAPPTIELPHVLELELSLDTRTSTSAHPAVLGDAPLGRAPPVR